MSATLISRQVHTSGIRPVNLRTDMAQLADLLELCFSAVMDESARASMREMRRVSQSAPLSALYSGVDTLFGGLDMGFVWEENGKVVGNISVSRANFPREMGSTYLIANVAVHPDYRQRGIATDLLHAAQDLIRQRDGKAAVLQVNVGNESTEAACRLYLHAGFKQERIFHRWVRTPQHRAPVKLPGMPFITLRQSNEWRAELALAELVRPNTQGGLGWLRATHPENFRKAWLPQMTEWLVGRSEERWIVRGDGTNGTKPNDIVASLRAVMPFSGPYLLELLVHPTRQGQLEAPLINYALRRLDSRYKSIILEHPADDLEASMVLEQYHFYQRATLIHMRCTF